MGVTRLKRKDRRNKTVSRLEVQFLKIGRAAIFCMKIRNAF
jgi:hypothetical protein